MQINEQAQQSFEFNGEKIGGQDWTHEIKRECSAGEIFVNACGYL